MPETDNAPNAVSVGDLALRAAVAYRVKARVADICDAVIRENAAYIESTKGVRSTAAKLPLPSGDSMPLTTFTQGVSKPKFVVEDEKALLDYADEKGETQYVIRPAYLEALMSHLRYIAKTNTVVDATTGEVVPGIGYEPGGEPTSISPKWNTQGKEALDDMLGFLDRALENLPELTAESFALPELEAGE
ncbi:hypothetical protein [Streptomyces rimosus]|uniref:hypothetical protein n=1 Tax=Streptomyces rimosus TaxID=1927 RepID=UPI0004C1A80B|nr:hypothetical protein [Streptomyces rimosus]